MRDATMKIFIKTTFDAAHRLPNVPSDHKCGRLHGHTFTVEIHVSGAVDTAKGWVADFADIKGAASHILEQLDHHYLNEIAGLENPTSEHIARWIWERLKPALPILVRVVVQESPMSGAVCEGADG